jgi:hypothetical protein
MGQGAAMVGRNDVLVANLAQTAAEDFQGETVIIHFERGTYFSLGGCAPAIWAMLQAPMTVDIMLGAIKARGHSLDPAFEAASLEFISQLLEHDLVRPTDASPAAPQLPEVISAADFTKTPAIEAFTDLAELIAMDPVHEVDVLEGWPRRPADERGKH